MPERAGVVETSGIRSRADDRMWFAGPPAGAWIGEKSLRAGTPAGTVRG